MNCTDRLGRWVKGLVLAAVLVLSPVAKAQVVAFDCFPMSAPQVVPPVFSTANGTGHAWFDPTTNTLAWNLAYQGTFGVTGSAQFCGPARVGANGPVQFTVTASSPMVGSATLTPGQSADLLAGLWYVNFPTNYQPDGEFRGQLVNRGCVVSYSCFPLDGSQTLPPSGSPAKGTGYAWFDRHDKRLEWHVDYAGLGSSPTSAHFHGAAAVGAMAGVKIDLGLAQPNVGSSIVVPIQVPFVSTGLWYIDVHTTGFPAGEIRGQFVDAPCLQWTDLGLGKPGALGTPLLAGRGTLVSGSSNELRLINAVPNGITHLFLGFSAFNAPFKGGTLTPFPDLFFPSLPVDGTGRHTLPFTLPVVPPGLSIWLQHWLPDPGAQGGISASNGLLLTTQ